MDAKGWVDFAAPDLVEHFQILSPVRMHAHGVYDLNRWLQRTFRARGRWDVTIGDEQIGRRDKVIQLRNEKRWGWSDGTGSQEMYLANGEIGTVFNAEWTKKGRRAKVLFAGRPGFSFSYGGASFSDDSPPLELAYALTVHKAQGSDFGIVFFVRPAVLEGGSSARSGETVVTGPRAGEQVGEYAGTYCTRCGGSRRMRVVARDDRCANLRSAAGRRRGDARADQTNSATPNTDTTSQPKVALP